MSSRRYRRRLERPRCHAPRLIPAGHGRRAEAGLLARGSIAPPSFADGELAAYSCGHSAGFEPASLFTAPIRDSTKVVKIGRAHVCTPVPNAHIVCRLLLEK